jgi:hypothetical protein
MKMVIPCEKSQVLGESIGVSISYNKTLKVLLIASKVKSLKRYTINSSTEIIFMILFFLFPSLYINIKAIAKAKVKNNIR